MNSFFEGIGGFNESLTMLAATHGRGKRSMVALQKPPFAGKSALFMTSDHGFAPFEELIRPNLELKRLGLIETDDKNKPTKRQAQCVAQGGSAFIYLLDAATRSEQLPRVKTALSKLEGVQQVIEPSDCAALCLPTPTENHEAPDLILATGSVVSFNGDLTGDVIGLATETYRRTHGHLPQPAYMHTTFIAAGTGIRSGVKLKSINNTDVAPTIARLLRLKLDDADGESLILNPAVDYYALGRMRPSTT